MGLRTVVLVLFTVGLATGAGAATRLWTGVGDGVRWSDGANWQEGIIPTDGDRVLFHDPAQATSNNDLLNVPLDGVDIVASAPFRLTGNTLILTGNVALRFYGSAATLAVDNNVRLDGLDPWIVSVGDGDVDMQLGIMTVNNGELTVVAEHGTFYLPHVLKEDTPGAIRVAGKSFVQRGIRTIGLKSLASLLTVRDLLNQGNSAYRIQGFGRLRLESDAYFPINLESTFDGSLPTLVLADGVTHGHSLVLDGDQWVASEGVGRLYGTIVGVGALVHDFSDGVLMIGSTGNQFHGPVAALQGTIRLVQGEVVPDGNAVVIGPQGALELGDGAETVNSLICVGGRLRVPTDGSYLRVLASSRVAGCTLEASVIEEAVPSSGEITLIRNDSGAPLEGNFTNVQEGSPLLVNGGVMSFTLAGGAGLDVALKSHVQVIGPEEMTTGLSTVTSVVVAVMTEDGSGPVPNRAVAFSIESDGPAGGSIFGQEGGISDAQGLASAILFTNASPGEYTIVARHRHSEARILVRQN